MHWSLKKHLLIDRQLRTFALQNMKKWVYYCWKLALVFSWPFFMNNMEPNERQYCHDSNQEEDCQASKAEHEAPAAFVGHP